MPQPVPLSSCPYLDSERVRLLLKRGSAVVVAVAGVALLASTGSAHTTFSLNNPVRITDSTCDLGYKAASHKYTRFVFSVFNLGTRPHGFIIATPYYQTGLIQPGQESTVVAYLPRPGAYRWACISAHATLRRGIFRIHRP